MLFRLAPRRLAQALGLLGLVGALSAAQEASLTTTFNGGNSRDGCMFEITAFRDLTLHHFDGHFEAGNVDVEVYFKAGDFLGFEASAGSWTLAGSATVASAGVGNPTPIPVQLGIEILGGEKYAFYITGKGGQNAPMLNTSGSGQIFTNGDLALTQGLGVEYPFGATHSPRLWNGVVYYDNPGLTASPDQISLASGGAQVLRLTFGADLAGSVYVLLGSVTGTSPGLPLDGNVLPLVYDTYTEFTLLASSTPPLSNFVGLLDGQGFAQAQFSLPPGLSTSLAGLKLYHASLVLDISGVPVFVAATSAATALEIVP